ncbi:MAG: hypothetical protein JWM88_253 [Verrucomicrobia bacterium]|nr:hypothetical protein [Verrucomicrobiota bacterium]
MTRSPSESSRPAARLECSAALRRVRAYLRAHGIGSAEIFPLAAAIIAEARLRTPPAAEPVAAAMAVAQERIARWPAGRRRVPPPPSPEIQLSHMVSKPVESEAGRASRPALAAWRRRVPGRIMTGLLIVAGLIKATLSASR